MEIRQIYRILIFSYITFLPIFITLWCMTILPQIISENLNYPSVKDQTRIAGLFFTSFFYGLIIGSFIWPQIVHLTTKRNLIFWAVLTQGFFTAILGFYNNIWWIVGCRFICGLMHNLNTVGKDFVFEFAKPNYRQYTFSFKSCFGILASFAGPFVGYYIYQFSGQSFMISNFIVAIAFAVGLVLFFLAFYLDFTPGEIEGNLNQTLELQKKDDIEEEDQELLPNERISETVEIIPEKKLSLWQVFLHCMKMPDVRGLIIIYFVANGVFKSVTMIVIFYIEQPYEKEGLGINNKNMSIITLISYFPSVIILMGSPKIVPKFFGYIKFIRTMTFILSISILTIPMIRDIFSEKFILENQWIIYLNVILLNAFNPKLFSPFVNYLVNSRVKREERTAVNSITFISSTLCSSLLINIVSVLYSDSFTDGFFLKLRPFNKYFSFVFLAVLLWVGILFTRKIVPKGSLKN